MRTLKLFELLDSVHGDATDQTHVSKVIAWAKEKGYLEKLGLDESNAKKYFISMLEEDSLPEGELKDKLIQVANEKAGENLPLSPDEAKRVRELIESGEIFNDIFYSFNTVFSVIKKPDGSFNLHDSFKDHIKVARELPNSLISDIEPDELFKQISSQIAHMKEGKSPDSPEILNNTLKTIFIAPEVGHSVEVVDKLLAPENESLRISLLVYARLNGINLNENDIDEVRHTILNKENPDLGALLSYISKSENATRLAGVG